MIADLDDEAAAALHNTIVECVWAREEGAWRFLRVRGDKDKPNAFHVYEKVQIVGFSLFGFLLGQGQTLSRRRLGSANALADL